jgi:hypothetical protein
LKKKSLAGKKSLSREKNIREIDEWR